MSKEQILEAIKGMTVLELKTVLVGISNYLRYSGVFFTNKFL